MGTQRLCRSGFAPDRDPSAASPHLSDKTAGVESDAARDGSQHDGNKDESPHGFGIPGTVSQFLRGFRLHARPPGDSGGGV